MVKALLKRAQALNQQLGGLGARIPKHVLAFVPVIEDVLREAGVTGKVKAFNSGYVGITITVSLGKYLYLDQPGVVGQEDQSGGSMSFGPYGPNPKVIVRHRGRQFGDVRLTDAERRGGQATVLAELRKILR